MSRRYWRTNCLSKLGGALPCSYSSAGQNRDESGVSSSSMRMSLPSTSPNSSLVSASRIPRIEAVRDPYL
jgi:hypothetical protein